MQIQKLHQRAFATAGAVIATTTMLLLGVLGNLSFYLGAVIMMRQWHVRNGTD